MRTRKAATPRAPLISGKASNGNSYQTVGQRIAHLRKSMKPYMTQKQLAVLSGIHLVTLILIEKDHQTNMETNTLRKIAWALGCHATVRIKKRPFPNEEECQLLGPALPKLPKRRGKTSGVARHLALLHAHSGRKKYRRMKYLGRRKATSESSDVSALPEGDKPE